MKNEARKSDRRGYTILELLIVLGLLISLGIGVTWLFSEDEQPPQPVSQHVAPVTVHQNNQPTTVVMTAPAEGSSGGGLWTGVLLGVVLSVVAVFGVMWFLSRQNAPPPPPPPQPPLPPTYY